MKKIKDVSFFGAGNVAWHLATMMHEAGIKINTVYSRHLDNALTLAQNTGAVAIDRVDDMPRDADLYIFALSDNAVGKVAKTFASKCKSGACVVHTSGMLDTGIFSPWYDCYGCFYPLQTFKKMQPLYNRDFPVFITARDSDFGTSLFELASVITEKVFFLDDKKRKALHVAAVFVNNFTNYLLAIAKNMVEGEEVEFGYLLPLLKETVDKILNGADPELIQTGPAVRGDTGTIEAHLKFLQKYPQYLKIYKVLTESIRRSKNG